jgi:hypothetical protein
LEQSLTTGAQRGRRLAQEQFERLQSTAQEFAQANPLAVAFGTLVAGMGVGLLLPSTRVEDELFETSRDWLKDTLDSARDAAQDAGRIIKETADDTLATVEGSAR